MEPTYQITPDGFSLIISAEDLEALDPSQQESAKRFIQYPWQALLDLGLEEPIENQSHVLMYLQKIAGAFIEDLLRVPGLEDQRDRAELVPDALRIEYLLSIKPFVRESELINEEWIRNIYRHLLEVFKDQIILYPGSVKKYFNEKNPRLNPAESIFFHLVENRNGIYPFAFLATYTHKSKEGIIRHLPLSMILEEYKDDQKKILELLSCLNQAAEICPVLGRFMASGELFHAIGMSEQEAYEFLKAVSALEQAGIVCRIPNWWRARSASISLNIKLGEKRSSLLGMDALISIVPALSVDGIKLTKSEIKQLLASADGLALIKGKWVEVNHKKLEALLKKMEEAPGEISLREALMIQSGLARPEWMDEEENIQMTNGKYLASVYQKLTDPEIIRKTALPKKLNAALRPYQVDGYNWLNALSALQFGALLADDMGLGKTIQTLAWLEKEHQKDKTRKALLIVPASLLANWTKESAQFTPDLSIGVIHGKKAISDFENTEYDDLPFLNLTTYGMAARLKKLQDIHWDFLILDEAQAIKNPKTKQTTILKKIPAQMKLAMTGTPIENNLINLWSIFDFLNSGLLGSLNQFTQFVRDVENNQTQSADKLSRLQKMISPFLLRRLKSDKSIINDLPDKIEQNDYITLSDTQTLLYQKIVNDLADRLESDESDDNGIQRKGLVLATLNKLKQVCNHPDQYLGQSDFRMSGSGKFEMLKEICEPMAQNHESVLVFTQYREMTEPLSRFLESIFGAKGCIIHGQTPISRRQEIVDAFNKQETYIPYVVLSLRAAGTGLNLTQASHVIHFDRWWNPAVENQATDRAYRIGQKKNVVVHKFVCANTIEENISLMIESKQKLADDVISSSTESWLTSLSDAELLEAMRMKL